MGREIRRVPPGWEHPKDARGDCHPLYDRDYESAAREWMDNCLAWENGTHPDAAEYKDDDHHYWWDWDGMPPDREYYRPAWTPEEATCFQMYETVTEGTPVSPVFDTLEELREWLVEQGYSPEAAAAFCEMGWAPSGVIVGGRYTAGIEATLLLRDGD